jgi:cysteinyl-tRNA synthetase
MKLYNSLTHQLEDFVPLKKGVVGMYTCGPTVYDFAHIGHGRKYVMDDLLKRTLTYNGYKVTHVQNITDVGHLVSDADEGEDKLEKGAKKTGKTVWQVAQYFSEIFFEDMDKLNILRPDVSCKATDNIKEQIELIERLINKEFAYDTPEAVYFSVSSFPRYGQMFGQSIDEKQAGMREDVITGSHKKHPADFALWVKTVGAHVNHTMRWESPWGTGFPGWHIECSAMSMKYLGESFDIHTGGIEHMAVHHPNEIAQSEAVTGKPFVKYWIHYGHLMIDGVKMSKSLGNFYRIDDIIEKGYSPLALRYLFMTAHYRTPLNFTWSSLSAAQTAYSKLKEFASSTFARKTLSKEKAKKINEFRAKFLAAVNNDLNFPQALAVVWEMIKSNVPDYDKQDLLLDWDQVLGLDLANSAIIEQVPDEVKKLAGIREGLRKEGKFVLADEVRVKIAELGWEVKDTPRGSVFKKN